MLKSLALRMHNANNPESVASAAVAIRGKGLDYSLKK
jgi:hypothetical protein